MKLLELPWIHVRGRSQHQVRHRLRLGKRDDVANVVSAAEHHHDAVDAGCDAPVWWYAIGEGFQQRSEPCADRFEWHAEELEHALLHGRVVDPEAPAAELVA